MNVELSVILVTHQSREVLADCLRSIAAHPPPGAYEILVVDNASTDGTREMLAADFPTAMVIANETNLGFAYANNQALRSAQGRYVLLLNNDSLILPGALGALVEFMESHPQAGIGGPKVLNANGTLQMQCRRSFALPWDLFCYFTGLAALFPRSRLFARYLMTYMGEDETHEADAVSGSCMLIRREVMDQIGLLDERFFAYQEDADYCFRARQACWQVHYVPAARVMHLGGMGGSRVNPYRSIYEWHRSYYLYYRKNLARRYFFLFNWLYYLAMGLKLLVSLGVSIFRRDKYAGSRKPGPGPKGASERLG
ncbi:MAG: glycosyltransferase family 2 protein [Chloroflexi bacterium]|nr:glycosyltransferase family 2 protein [Chloroflexota bacterium]